MKKYLRAPISTFVAISTGIILLSSYFIPLDGIRDRILSWVVILTSATLLIGLVNLFSVHLNKLSDDTTSLYSFALILAMLGSFTFTFFPSVTSLPKSFEQWTFTYIQLPIETSLMAVMAVTMTYASTKILKRNLTVFSLIFSATFFIVLLGSGPIFGSEIPIISDTLRPWITQILAGAGAKGLLLGVSLGTITTGLRILIGIDRPYGG
jgi:hypothetical protein